MESIMIVNRKNGRVALNGSNKADPNGMLNSWNDSQGCRLSQFTQWKTCLRHVFFLHVTELDLFPLEEGDEVYEAELAYQFLLEVLCGLQSPMIGETEVLGQFKEFLKQNEGSSFIKREKSFFNQLLQDCKLVREENLQQLGCHSYGSLSRRLLKDIQSVKFVGAGQLVKEILPWLKEVKSISILSRDSSRMTSLQEVRSNLKWFSIKDSEHRTNSVEGYVICAPMSNEELLTLLEESEIKILLDLRGESSFNEKNLPQVKQYYSLGQFMDSIRQDRAHTELKVQEAKKQISRLVDERRKKAVLRPHGWEDLWC